MLYQLRVCFFGLFAFVLAMLLSLPVYSEQVENSSSVTSFLILIQPEIELEIVEWGGEGEPVVFLAGLGHTAHVFDEFAPRFCDQFRVLGITRRGHGLSSKPETGYDLATLTEDIRIVLDSLKIERAILAGHSLAGDEMTKFASTYPERVRALVYIEAAHDRISIRDTLANYPNPESTPFSPTDDDRASVSAFLDYYEKANGVRWPVAEVHALFNVEPDGKVGYHVIPGYVYGGIKDAMENPDYSRIDVPALAIYGIDYPITELYSDYETRDTIVQAQIRQRYEVSRKMGAASRQTFMTEMKKGKVAEVMGAGHSLYLTHAEDATRIMYNFLNEL